MTEPTITCPKCGAEIKFAESLAACMGTAGQSLQEIEWLEFHTLSNEGVKNVD